MRKHNPVLYFLVLALFLVLIVISYFLFFVDSSFSQSSFADSLVAAENALGSGSTAIFRREIMRAGKYAVEVKEWKQLLALTASAASNEDYGLFSTMAGRAVVQNPGNNDLLAYWVWGLLRDGNIEKASQYAPALSEERWGILQSEVRIKSLLGESDDDLQAFSLQLNEKLDPDFFSYASSLTGSAELAVDAALMYMQIGDRKRAYEMAWTVVNGNRNWHDVGKIPSSTIAMAKIAYDAGYYDEAAAWLFSIEDIGDEWQELQFAGDVFWKKYSLGNEKDYAREALIYWNKAINTIKGFGGVPPQSSWPVWLNRVLAFNEFHSLERAEEALQETLDLFSGTSQVRAAWAIANVHELPSLAHRVLQDGERDPVLMFARIKTNPQAGNPQMYESALWELFDEVTDRKNLPEPDRRNITSFLMNYLWSRNDFRSMGIVINRYRNSFGEEEWMLPWIMVNDVARGVAVIDLLPKKAGGVSNYERVRQGVRMKMDWEALHDLVLYSLFAVRNLYDIQSNYQSGESEIDESLSEAAIMFWLLDNMESMSSELGNRINQFETGRDDLKVHLKNLKQGRTDMPSVRASLGQKINELLGNSSEDIKMIHEQDATVRAEVVRLEKLVQEASLPK